MERRYKATGITDRATIVCMWASGRSVREVARETGSSVTTVYRWIRRWRQEGSLRTRRRCGRPRLDAKVEGLDVNSARSAVAFSMGPVPYLGMYRSQESDLPRLKNAEGTDVLLKNSAPITEAVTHLAKRWLCNDIKTPGHDSASDYSKYSYCGSHFSLCGLQYSLSD